MAFFKTIWKPNSKHEKLSEERALQNSNLETESTGNLNSENDVVSFKLKYLGSTVVERKSDDNITTEAVRNILKTAKATKGRKKLQRVNVAISLQGIDVTDLQGNDIFKISIYRIFNCSTDPTHRQIFSFSSTDEKDITQCHAFLCSRRKTAETATLAVGHAFKAMYEVCRLESPPSVDPQKFGVLEREQNDLNQADKMKNEEERLISFDDEPIAAVEEDLFFFDMPAGKNDIQTHWVCFDDEFIGGTPSKTANTSHLTIV